MSKNGGEVTVAVPRRQGLVFQLQNLPGTDVWAIVVKGELNELIEKARRWDIHQGEVGIGDRVCYFKQYGDRQPIRVEKVEEEANGEE
jgi:hypothetical protein